jgi:seryl-tRNA synthetase
MLSVEYIRNNKDTVAEGIKKKNKEIDLDLILTLDDKRRELIGEVQKIREERNRASSEKPTEEGIAKGRELKDRLKEVEVSLFQAEDELRKKLLEVPNVPLSHVPAGDESQNKVLRKEGSPTELSFMFLTSSGPPRSQEVDSHTLRMKVCFLSWPLSPMP